MSRRKHKFAEKNGSHYKKGIKYDDLSDEEKKKLNYNIKQISKFYALMRINKDNLDKVKKYKSQIKILRREQRILLKQEDPIVPEHPAFLELDWLREQLYVAYLAARKHKRGTIDEQKFEENLMPNICNLACNIYDRNYNLQRSLAFVVTKPVKREVFAAEFRDRVVQHFLVNFIGKWWDNHLINNSFSCRKRRGTHYGQRRLQHDMLSMASKTNSAYIMKFDIKGYFMHILKPVLFRRLVWGLKREFTENKDDWLYRLLKYVLHQTIFDCPQHHCFRRGTRTNWHGIPPDKSLFYQPTFRGLPIGNYISQLSSNVYLDMFDRLMVYELGHIGYGRYVDDFYVVIRSDEIDDFMVELFNTITPFLLGIGLRRHPNKCYVQNMNHGALFIGGYITLWHISPSPRMISGLNIGMQKFIHDKESEESLTARLGMMKNHHKIMKKVFDYNNQDYHF